MSYHPFLPLRLLLVVWLLVAGSLSAAALICRHAAGETGLTLTVRSGPDLTRSAPARRVSTLDVRDLWEDAGGGPVRAQWDGLWQVREAGPYELEARSEDDVSVSLDGREVLARRRGARSRGAGARIDPGPGFHALRLIYEAGVPRDLRLVSSRPGESPRDLDPESLFTAMPSEAQQARGRWAATLGHLALGVWLVPPVALVIVGAVGGRRTGRWLPEGWKPAWWRDGASARMRAGLRVALPALVVLYAGALRFEALVGRYSWQGPRWALEAERALRVLHPASLRWQPALEGYSGDPYNYLVRAREMDGFYEPNVREPLFPFVTRQLLRLLGDRNVAVNAASALFSTLAVLATYLLGAGAFSPAVGLAAALGMAVHRDVLWFGVEGFRDDAFTLFVVGSALALLRVRQRPTLARAVVAGLLAGAAVLSRITAFSFLVPAFGWAFGPGARTAERRRALAVSVVTLLAVAGPYLLSCALAYGDPFYAVNFHTRFYRGRSGLSADGSMSWLEYLRTGFRPFHLLDTGLTGLTTYPFANKWHGFDYISPWAGQILAAAAVAGLVLFLGSPAGRLLLVVLLCSLLPFAFTWEVPGGAEWRFTMNALPFYLIAAGLALTRGAALARAAAWRDVGRRLRERRLAIAAGALAVLAVAAWAGLCALSYLRVRESLQAGEAATIAAGSRDWFFFGPGWSPPRRRGLLRVRRAEGPSVVWIPMGLGGDCRVTLRVDPDPPAPVRPLAAGLNGVPVSSLTLQWDEKRIGSYELVLPARLRQPGRNRLDLSPGGFVLWYVRVEPAGGPVSAAGSAR